MRSSCRRTAGPLEACRTQLCSSPGRVVLPCPLRHREQTKPSLSNRRERKCRKQATDPHRLQSAARNGDRASPQIPHLKIRVIAPHSSSVSPTSPRLLHRTTLTMPAGSGLTTGVMGPHASDGGICLGAFGNAVSASYAHGATRKLYFRFGLRFQRDAAAKGGV